ncbi:SHOOT GRAVITROPISM 5 protein [Nymphaea thermarum]|nr:SHOOT GRAVITROPISM 5 protein [Nymphaea thermarum]
MDQRELQLLPDKRSTGKTPEFPPPSVYCISFSGSTPGCSNLPSTDLQLSISPQPVNSYSPSARPTRQQAFLRRSSEHGFEKIMKGYDETRSEICCAEAMKRQAEEQLRLAAVEKAYAEKVRELTRQEMELAESEFACARHMWEKAAEDMERARRMKDKATRHVDSNGMEITCHACQQQFRV